jgi:hypothetical protein
MLVKYINKYKIKKADKSEILIDGDKQIINPTDEDFIRAGYKLLIQDDVPEYDEEIEYIIPYYELGDDAVYQKWEIHEIGDEENEMVKE